MPRFDVLPSYRSRVDRNDSIVPNEIIDGNGPSRQIVYFRFRFKEAMMNYRIVPGRLVRDDVPNFDDLQAPTIVNTYRVPSTVYLGDAINQLIKLFGVMEKTNIPLAVQELHIMRPLDSLVRKAIRGATDPAKPIGIDVSVIYIEFAPWDPSHEFNTAQYEIKFVPASETAIKQHLKSFSFEGGTDENCPICLVELEKGEEIVQMPCSHFYHDHCIVKWLRKSHMCPMCRYKLPRN